MFRIRHKLDPSFVDANDEAVGLNSDESSYANRHIPSFLRLLAAPPASSENSIQLIQDGRQLTAEALMRGDLDISRPILVKDTPESIGMTVFRPSSVRKGIDESVTVRHVADVIGHHYPVRVLDVETQEELNGWTMGDLVEVFEDDDRIGKNSQQQQQTNNNDTQSTKRVKRKAAEKASDAILNHQNRPRALNQLSLEFSDTPLGKFVESPRFVRELDWIDNAWPQELRKDKKSYPAVQYYCLTSTSGCFTDFHVDFGGTAVYYHVLTGAKEFCLIKPSTQNLAIYETWLKHPKQESLFLPNMIPNQETDVITVRLRPGQTLFIPSAWIHSVYTPQDSVVLGGNMLHGLDLPLQLEANAIEDKTRVADKFRFPFFKNLHFYVASMYMRKLQNDEPISKRELDNLPEFLRAIEKWKLELGDGSSINSQQNKGLKDSALHAAKLSGCDTVDELLQKVRECYDKAIKEGFQSHSLDGNCTKSNPFCKQGLSISKPVSNDGTTIHSHRVAPIPKSPRIRLNLGQSSPRDGAKKTPGNRSSDDGGEFKIVISQEAKELHKPLPFHSGSVKTKKNTREDTEFVDSGDDDDDWVPSLSLRKKVTAPARHQVKSTTSAKNNAFNSNRETIPNSTKGASTGTTYKRAAGRQQVKPANKKQKTTARQRLLKRIR